ncbi:unnamed protein product [Urochloa humidicola]
MLAPVICGMIPYRATICMFQKLPKIPPLNARHAMAPLAPPDCVIIFVAEAGSLNAGDALASGDEPHSGDKEDEEEDSDEDDEEQGYGSDECEGMSSVKRWNLW